MAPSMAYASVMAATVPSLAWATQPGNITVSTVCFAGRAVFAISIVAGLATSHDLHEHCIIQPLAKACPHAVRSVRFGMQLRL